ncbi:serine hydrolase [Microbacterium azadirachtae]|uniref:serine hydrolase n=1 Tax=Microbacterium azadirachtae TaxID=582680 RepID=UPI0024AF4C92|nr:serine hydrolase [Microbacterium azadirachtae]
MRLSHLVSHTSGIDEPPLDTPVPLRDELIRRGRDFPAGTTSRYSTLAFAGVAALIEHVTGETWDAAISAWTRAVGAHGITLDPTRGWPTCCSPTAQYAVASIPTNSTTPSSQLRDSLRGTPGVLRGIGTWPCRRGDDRGCRRRHLR